MRIIYNKNYKSTKRLLREALKKAPDDVRVLTQLANLLWNKHKDEESLCYADKAKALSAKFPLLDFTRARILWSLGMYEQSIEEWDVILKMSINEVTQEGYGIRWAKSVINDARYYKADCLYHLFKDKEALPLMEEHLAMRKRGIESDFTKKEAVLFYKVLKYSHPSECVKDTDVGYASEVQKKRVSKRIDELENNKDWKRLVKYLQVVISHYPMEYYLKTILSVYCQKTDDKDGCLKYASEAFAQEPYDPLVKYNYAMALMLNHFEDKALKQFEEIVDLGEDYIAYSEHGEGMRWAKKLLQDKQKQIIKNTTNDMIRFFLFFLLCSFVVTSCAQDDTAKYEKAVQQKFDQFFHTHDTTFAREVVANCDSVLARRSIGDPKYFYHMYTKATMLKFLGKYNESLETENRYYAARDSTSARYYELVALQHKMRGEVQMAKTCYLKAIEKYETYPQTESTVLFIAGCYLNMGEEKTAKKKLKEYLKTNDSKVVKEVLYSFKGMKNVNTEALRLMKSENKFR